MAADSGHAESVNEPNGHPTGGLPTPLAETLRYGPFHRALRGRTHGARIAEPSRPP